MQHEQLTRQIIACAFTVHNALGGGFLESVYEKAFALELKARGIAFETQVKIPVNYRGERVGNFVGDVLVCQVVLCELKATESLALIHEVQLVNYLKATGLDIGLLINFGPQKVEVKRKYRQLTT